MGEGFHGLLLGILVLNYSFIKKKKKKDVILIYYSA